MNNNFNNNYGNNNANNNYYNGGNMNNGFGGNNPRNMNNGFNGNNTGYPVAPPPKKKGNGAVKIVIAVCSVILFVVVAVIIGVAVFLLGGSSSEKVVKLLDEGKYSEAFDKYVELYGRGNSDEELDDAIYDRLEKIKEDFDDGALDYDQAAEELEVYEDMKIEKFEDEIAEVSEYISDKDETAKSPEEESPTKQQADGTTQSHLPTEPVPENPVSYYPRISNASTLKGEVLSASNVNAARSFGANKAIDGYYDSCWCVNTKSTGGAGAQIRFTLSEKSYVSGFKLINGNLYKPETDIYSLNGQVKDFTLTFSDGTRKSFVASYNGTGVANYQYFDFSEPIATDYIILTVDSAYVGSNFTTNVCLGEFEVY